MLTFLIFPENMYKTYSEDLNTYCQTVAPCSRARQKWCLADLAFGPKIRDILLESSLLICGLLIAFLLTALKFCGYP